MHLQTTGLPRAKKPPPPFEAFESDAESPRRLLIESLRVHTNGVVRQHAF